MAEAFESHDLIRNMNEVVTGIYKARCTFARSEYSAEFH